MVVDEQPERGTRPRFTDHRSETLDAESIKFVEGDLGDTYGATSPRRVLTIDGNQSGPRSGAGRDTAACPRLHRCRQGQPAGDAGDKGRYLRGESECEQCRDDHTTGDADQQESLHPVGPAVVDRAGRAHERAVGTGPQFFPGVGDNARLERPLLLLPPRVHRRTVVVHPPFEPAPPRTKDPSFWCTEMTPGVISVHQNPIRTDVCRLQGVFE